MEGANPHGIRVYTDTELSQVSLSKNAGQEKTGFLPLCNA